jgi:hypothetical protein
MILAYLILVSELAPEPVAFYAMVFFLANATYMALIWELIDRAPVDQVSPAVRRIMRVRSIATLCDDSIARTYQSCRWNDCPMAALQR